MNLSATIPALDKRANEHYPAGVPRLPRDDEEERRLVERYVRGDVAAFDQLYERLGSLTYSMLVKSTKNKPTANDLHQDVWERIIRSMHTWRPIAPFRAWVFTILHNSLRDHWKRPALRLEIVGADSRQNREPEDRAPETLRKQDGEAEARAHATIRDPLLQKLIDDCLGHLEPEQKDVVLMHTAEMTFAEISEIMGTPPGTANRRWQLAVEHLKRCLARSGIEESPS